MSPLAWRIPGRRLMWLLGLGASAGLVGGPTAASAVPAAAATTTPTPAHGLTITDQTFALTVGDTMTFELGAPDGILTSHDGAKPVTVTVTARPAVIDAEGIREPTSGDGVASVSVPVTDGVTTDDGSTGTVTVTLGPGGLTFPQAGVYPITVDVDEVSGASTTTFVEFVDDDGPPGPITVGILATVADPGPAASPEALADARRAMASVVQLAAAVDAPLTLALPPRAVSALADESVAAAPAPDTVAPADGSTPPAGTADDASTIAATSSSTTATTSDESAVVETAGMDEFRGDELLARPLDDLDPSAVIAVDGPDFDAEEFFGGELSDGQDVLDRAGPAADVDRSVWVSDRPVSDPGAAMLRRLGTRLLIMSAASSRSLGIGDPAAGFDVSLSNGSVLTGVSVSPLGEQLRAANGPGGPADANAIAVRLLAEVLVTQDASGAPAVVLGLDDLGVPDPAITARFAQLVSSTDGVTIEPLSRLGNDVERTAGLDQATFPPRAGTDLTARVIDIAETRTRATSASSMLVDSPLPARWSAELDSLLASNVDDPEVGRRLDATNNEIDAVFGAIVPPEPSTFTITGSASTLHFNLENTSDMPLMVAVDVRSPPRKLTFPDGVQTVPVPAASSARVDVPVRAHTNGTFSISVNLLTPVGAEPISRPVVLKARVTRLTGLGQVVTGGAILVLISWWYSHLRRKRQQRRAVGDAIASGTT